MFLEWAVGGGKIGPCESVDCDVCDARLESEDIVCAIVWCRDSYAVARSSIRA